MRRESYPEKTNYYGPPYSPQTSSISFASFPKPNPPPKQLSNLGYADYLHAKNNQFGAHRYSLQPNTADPTNALRYQINNLRSDFNRLIQPSQEKGGQASVKGLNYQQRDEKVALYTGEVKLQKVESSRQTGSFNFRSKFVGQQSGAMEFDGEKRAMFKKQQSFPRLQKRFSTQYMEKMQDRPTILRADSNTDGNTVEQLSKQNQSLKQANRRLQQQNAELKREVLKKQGEFTQKMVAVTNDLQNVRTVNGQINISLSLKEGLLEKMQRQGQRVKRQMECLQREMGSQQAERLKEKYETQINSLQGIHRQNMEIAIEKYRVAEQQSQRVALELSKRQDEVARNMKCIEQMKKRQVANELQAEKRDSDLLVLSKANEELKEENRRLSLKFSEQQTQIESLRKKTLNNGSPKLTGDSQQFRLRLQQLQEENVELRKRVESYRKTVELLNVSNNSAREKQVVLREQNKSLKEQVVNLREEAKLICEQNRIKESLITSLYRDINILNNQIRAAHHLKSQLAGDNRYIEELNHQIIGLECEKLDRKYSADQ